MSGYDGVARGLAKAGYDLASQSLVGGMLALPGKSFVGLGSPISNAGRLARLVDAGGSQLVFAQGGKWANLAGAAIVARPGYSFADGVVLSGITATRLGNGYYVDRNGAYVLAPINTPRINYRYVSGAPVLAGLLVEPRTSTNLFLQSENFESNSWAKGAATITANAVAAPNGTMTADLYTETGTVSSIRQSVAVFAGAAYTFTMHMKRSNYDWHFWGIGDDLSTTNGVRAWFNLATGAVGVATTNGLGWSYVDHKMIDVGGGFYRVILIVVTGGTTAICRSTSAEADGVSRRANVGNGTGVGASAALWGAMFAAESVASSYIPTLAEQVTRAPDVLAIDWAGQGVADGAITARYTFDDGTTQDVATTVASGTSTIPTNLNRPNILRVEKI